VYLALDRDLLLASVYCKLSFSQCNSSKLLVKKVYG
jgi:hypothetical protein